MRQVMDNKNTEHPLVESASYGLPQGNNGAKIPRRMRNVLALDDLEPLARRHLPAPIFGYISGASETNASLHGNRKVFSEYGFRPRILVGVSERSTATSLFGVSYDAPFGIAPRGVSSLAAYRGDLVLARAARDCGIAMIMSGSSLIRLEDVMDEAPGSWFQAYLPGEPDRIEGLVARVEDAGFKTLVLTVDVAVMANRENNVRNGYQTPMQVNPKLIWDGVTHPSWAIGTFLRTIVQHGMPHFENSYATRGEPLLAKSVLRDFGRRSHLNWSHLEQIRKQWSGRLVVKGILTGEDAARARESGADSVIVSNHGGRQLDGAIAPLRALSEVVDVAGDMPVMLDGGIRRGSDVLKALALGAKFVFVGRPFLYAAALGGVAGVVHSADLLKLEIDRDMALLGLNRLEDLGPQHVVKISGAG
jgi:L-lactate dehydrogenase (cytochrome)